MYLGGDRSEACTDCGGKKVPEVEQQAWVDRDCAPRSALHGLFPPIRSVVLLGGLVRPTQLSGSIGRSLLDLPIDCERTVMDHWYEQADSLAEAGRFEKVAVRILIDQKSPSPRVVASGPRVAMRVEHDRATYRGTGGVLHDLAAEYDDGEFLLVGNASQLMLEPLPGLVRRLAREQADVAIVSHADGTPSGVALIRCGAMRGISPIGFVDFKEQALPAIAREYSVRVVRCGAATSASIRTPTDYVGALLAVSRRGQGRSLGAAEDWRVSFEITEPGAEVDPSARVHDSVILSGARVQRGAVMVRAVVCPGAVVRRGQTVVDRLVKCESGRDGKK